MVPTSRIEAFVPAEAAITAPVTKFGGQPVWLAEPQWPVNDAWGEPMRFICQIELEAVLGDAGRGKLAYVFVTHAEHGDEAFFDPDIACPDEGANAVVVQPGGVYPGTTLPAATGPGLYHRADGSRAEYGVRLRRGEDPAFLSGYEYAALPDGERDRYWEAVAGDKIGGTPAFFQGDEWPDGGPWRLALQLDPDFLPFHLNLGAAPTAFAFVSQDARHGCFLVQDS
ncbi:DUF1963 domain-containing protein [Actinacidiphila bryophytorum]|uniref:DUF1963 domain-containing protein n=1 Tax=Actinacidiphila bryophytorum TaxID=1436133 RepID=A0A9W4ECY2_9ACTN|nr:DUF1963 domain-containing protein [Actinacidiphila bryophytorum]MBM9438029.1 DUF1963 domain-containing protein [Actinacidiphila bryophytorum]MBN6541668.1 DUF1963 domain-containing protein [Actinacidiphila bryophytorum]CAG7618065.1 conserved hypothetical protein [Actinacidiphila bryophytorum]